MNHHAEINLGERGGTLKTFKLEINGSACTFFQSNVRHSDFRAFWLYGSSSTRSLGQSSSIIISAHSENYADSDVLFVRFGYFDCSAQAACSPNKLVVS